MASPLSPSPTVGAKFDQPSPQQLDLIDTRALVRPHETSLPRSTGSYWRVPSFSWSLFIARYWLFLLVVVFPVCAASLYFGFIAADRFVSESKFVVRAPGSADNSAMAMVSRGDASNRTADDTHAVNAYILSRSAATELERDHALRDVMSRPEGDLFYRFPNFYTASNVENFYAAFKRFVDVKVEVNTGISTLTVTAFRPEDAVRIAEAVLTIAEIFLNRLQERARRDEMAFALANVDEARGHLTNVVERLATYRNEQQVLDPQAESTNRLASLNKVETEIAHLNAALAQQVAMAPQSPLIPAMDEKIRSLRNELERQRATVVGGGSSMVTRFQAYELLIIERDLASRRLVDAVVQMDKARQDSERKGLYLQRVVEPHMPDYAAGPHRILGIILVFCLALIIFGIVKNILALVLEHQ